MKTPTLIEAAVVKLMHTYPLWCELFYSMEIIIADWVKTACTDARRMWINPAYWASLDKMYRPSLLAHEVTHKMLHHCTRGKGFLEPYDGIACDIVANTMLAKNGFPIHPDWVQPEAKYDGWTFEAVYYDLIKDLKKPPPQPQGGGGQGKPQQGQDGGKDEGEQVPQAGKGKEQKDGKGKDQGPPKNVGQSAGEIDPSVPAKYAKASMDVNRQTGVPEQLERFEQEVEQAVQQAIATAKMMGKAPAGVEMAMEKIRVVPEEKWYDHLRRYMQSMSQAEMNWARINRRTAALYGIVAPTQYTEQMGEIVIFRDTSGSCYTKAVQAGFNGHVGAIIDEAKPKRLHVADFDTKVHAHREVEPHELEFDAPPVGGGGTSFTELFPWIEAQGIVPEVVIILTDMYGTFPREAPEFAVIWASTSRGIKGPFGETIEIK